MASLMNLTLTLAFWIICPFFIMTLPAHSGEKFREYTITPPPSCVNNSVETVVFKNVENGQEDSAAGMAKRDENGRPVVYRFNYKNSPKPLQQFIDLHECAHHQTADVNLPYLTRTSPALMMNESIADCIATLRIRDETNGGKDVVLQNVEHLMKAMTKIGFHESTKNSRKSNILNCVNKENSADFFVEGILRHRGLK